MNSKKGVAPKPCETHRQPCHSHRVYGQKVRRHATVDEELALYPIGESGGSKLLIPRIKRELEEGGE